MKLKIIIQNQGLFLSKDVDFVGANSETGNLGIMDQHISMITALKEPGHLYYYQGEEPVEGETEHLYLEKALLEVKRDNQETYVQIIAKSIIENQ